MSPATVPLCSEELMRLADALLGPDSIAAMRAMSRVYVCIRDGSLDRRGLDVLLRRLRWVNEHARRRGAGSTGQW